MEGSKEQSKKMEQNAVQQDDTLADQEFDQDLTAAKYNAMFQKKWPHEYEELKTVGQNQKFEPHLYRKNDCLRLIQNIKKDSPENFAFGCIIGNFLADACGSRDEFVQKTLKTEHMDETMKMPGGGYHKTGPGQGTDDSELATCILLGLIDTNIAPYLGGKENEYKAHLNMDRVAMRYRDWYESNPFDCGQTVRGSLSALTRHTRELAQPPSWDLIVRETGAKDIYKVTQRVNTNSKSNGSLMKICPLAIWASGIVKGCTDPVAEFEQYKRYRDIIDDDVKIIHNEPLTRSCIFVYSLAISHMFNNNTDVNRAKQAFDLAYTCGSTKLANEEADNGLASVCKWIDEAKDVFKETQGGFIYDGSEDMVEKYKCTSAIGFIKHAFILSFYYLLKIDHWKNDAERMKGMYKECVREVISLGGDTDTNACIVGGIIGAYLGVNNVDYTMMGVYFDWDPTDPKKQVKDDDKTYGRDRPLWMNLGQNAIDSIFWLCTLRIQNQLDCENKYDEMVKLKEGDKIKN